MATCRRRLQRSAGGPPPQQKAARADVENSQLRSDRRAAPVATLTQEILDSIDRSVLCWLATADPDNVPNVSPKEMFTEYGDDKLLMAHLASPVSVHNIRENPKACVSFVDVFVQKGYKLKGSARILSPSDPAFASYRSRLVDLYSDKWPIKAVIEVTVTSAAKILAPSYVLFPQTTTEATQVQSAMRAYGVRPASG